VLIVALQWFGRFVVPLAIPDALPFGAIGGLAGGLLIIVWWAFFSRAPRSERWLGVAVMVLVLVVTSRIVHPSIATGGMGMLFFMYAVPTLSLAFVLWAVATRNLRARPRRLAMVAAIVIGCGMWALVQTGGFTANLDSDFSWRWAQTPEDKLLAEAGAETLAAPPDMLETGTGAEWPGFRGPSRDSIIPDVQIETDWAASPPVELWRRAVGPGWSSFAVHGDLFYTQEQRGDEEIVSCYKVSTGELVWQHGNTARFWESNGGAGPRGTPTLAGDRVYTFGGTGIVNALDARDGSVIWSRNAETDTGSKLPMWGYSSSPLVHGDLVIIAAAGALIAYEIEDGSPSWRRPPEGGDGYSSPHLMTIEGVEQVLLQTGEGMVSVAPGDGTVLWQHPWPGYPIVQPALTADGDILITANEQSGTRRISATQGPDGWSVEEVWTSIRLKSYFSDFSIHKGHAYGFDRSILASINVEDGQRNWKGGRYGSGQQVLLADQDLLLVLSEQGELALVSATPDKFTEVARFPAIEGKTWNHPALVGDVLLVRNGEEMAAFRLSLASEAARSDESFHRTYIPEGEGPFPTVIAIPGCSGVSLDGPAMDAGRPGDEGDRLFRRHYARMAERLQQAGFGVVLVDYLTAEGVRNTCSGEIPHERVAEYISSSLDLTATLPWVDPSRINVIGWSHGGGGLIAWLESLGEQSSAAAGAIAVYPPCGRRSPWTSPLPVLMLLGGIDDIAQPEPCEQLAGNMPDGTILEVHNYPDGRHGFDMTEGPELLPLGGGVTLGRNAEAGEDAWRRILDFLAEGDA
jgi:outer membrane protein assembly factor BamB